jgi:hypothetical protein
MRRGSERPWLGRASTPISLSGPLEPRIALDILISDTGELWSLSGHELPRPPRLGPGALASVPRRSRPFYVRLQLLPTGAGVHLGEVPITRACFERVVWLLITFRVERAIVESPGEQLKPELLTSFEDIVARLDEVRGEAHGEPPRAAFIVQRLALERLTELSRKAMYGTGREWGRARGRLSVDDLKRECGAVNGMRTLLHLKRGKRLETNAVSDVVRAYLCCERTSMLGREVEDLPDPVYGDWLASAYRELASGGPKPRRNWSRR